MNLNQNDRDSNVRGSSDTWSETSFERNVTLLNMISVFVEGPYWFVQGDACKMQTFADTYFK